MTIIEDIEVHIRAAENQIAAAKKFLEELKTAQQCPLEEGEPVKCMVTIDKDRYRAYVSVGETPEGEYKKEYPNSVIIAVPWGYKEKESTLALARRFIGDKSD